MSCQTPVVCGPVTALNCDRSIRLVISELANQNLTNFQVFRFRIEAVEAIGLDRNIFLYQRHPPDPYTGVEEDEFCTVASPVDLVEYPVNDPDPARDYPFLRKNFVDMLFRSTADAEAARNKILLAIGVMLDALCRLDDLVVSQDIWVPCPPPVSASGSASASISSSGSASASV